MTTSGGWVFAARARRDLRRSTRIRFTRTDEETVYVLRVLPRGRAYRD